MTNGRVISAEKDSSMAEALQNFSPLCADPESEFDILEGYE